MTRTTARLVRMAGGLVAGTLVLAGCSDSGETSASTAGGASSSASSSDTSSSENEAFNDADLTFVQGMIPHHRGALEMARLANGRAEDPRVRDLAGRIEAAQEPEIGTMTSWLEEWGEELPEDNAGGMSGMDHSGMDMGGMDMGGMSEGDMADLEAASGVEFDRMFLEMMTEHHRGAVDMAQIEIEDGRYPDAVQLAEDIVASQTAEIEEMETLLTELGS